MKSPKAICSSCVAEHSGTDQTGTSQPSMVPAEPAPTRPLQTPPEQVLMLTLASPTVHVPAAMEAKARNLQSVEAAKLVDCLEERATARYVRRPHRLYFELRVAHC